MKAKAGADGRGGPGRRVCLAQQGTKKKGEAAELAFMLKAVSIGFGVAKPWGDSERYDFILDSGTRLWRVQVKSSSHTDSGAYFVNSKRHMNGKSIPYRIGEIDFLVAQIVPEDLWYVIPLKAILPRQSLRIYPEKDPRPGDFRKYREAWHLIG
jgi:hypothetical protein